MSLSASSRVPVVENAELHGARLALVDRGEAVDRHHHGLRPIRRPAVEEIGDGGVKRPVDLARAHQPVVGRQVPVAGNMGGLADLRHGVGRVGWPVAVVGQPRVALQHERRIHELGEQAGHLLRTDVPGNVALQFGLGQPQGPERLRQPVGRVLADEDIAAPAAAVHQEGRSLFTLEKASHHAKRT